MSAGWDFILQITSGPRSLTINFILGLQCSPKKYNLFAFAETSLTGREGTKIITRSLKNHHNGNWRRVTRRFMNILFRYLHRLSSFRVINYVLALVLLVNLLLIWYLKRDFLYYKRKLLQRIIIMKI